MQVEQEVEAQAIQSWEVMEMDVVRLHYPFVNMISMHTQTCPQMPR